MKKIIFGITIVLLYIFMPLSAHARDPVFDAYDAYDRGDYKKAYDGFLPIAQAGNVDVQFLVGYLFFEGEGVAQSYDNAASWFVKAAKNGHVTSMLSLGEMYETDQLGPNTYEALRWYKMAADAGNKLGKTKYDALKPKHDALQIAGRTKVDGFYDQPQQQKPTITNAASNADPDLPKIYLGTPYNVRTLTTKEKQARSTHFRWSQDAHEKGDFPKARFWCQIYAEAGFVPCQNMLGKSYETKGNYTEALKWHKRAAAGQRNGKYQSYITKSQISVGTAYRNGQGVAKNKPLMLAWYIQSLRDDKQLSGTDLLIQQSMSIVVGNYYKEGEIVKKSERKALDYFRAGGDDAKVIRIMGIMLDKGIDDNPPTAADRRLATKYYRQAADLGDAIAQFKMGLRYQNGDTVKQSFQLASQYYEKASNQGEVTAQHNLAVQYVNGQGVPQSYEKAVKLFEKAAWKDYVLSQYALGIFYVEGKGVKKSEIMGLFWLKKAANLGDKPAQEILTKSGETW